MGRPRSFREAVGPLITMHNAIGMGIVEYPKGRPRPLVSCAYTLLVLAAYGYIITEAKPYAESYYSPAVYPMRSLLFLLLFYGSDIFTVAIFVAGLAKAKAVNDAIAYAEACETRMRRLGVRTDYGAIRSRLIRWYALVLSIFFISDASSCYWTVADGTPLERALVLEICIGFTDTSTTVASIAFISFTRYWQSKFQQLNDELRARFASNVVSTSEDDSVAGTQRRSAGNPPVFVMQSTRDDKEDVEFIRTARKLHQALTRGATMTNEAFGWQILISTIIAFITVTCLLYFFYIIFEDNVYTVQVIVDAVVTFVWISIYTAMMLATAYACARTSAEAADIGEVVCELYDTSRSGEFRTEVRDFAVQLLQNPLTFTANGFFVLDRNFIYEVIGWIATYFMIILQASDLPESESIEDSPGNFTNQTYPGGWTPDE